MTSIRNPYVLNPVTGKMDDTRVVGGGSVPSSAGMDYANSLYSGAGRQGDSEGLNYWASQYDKLGASGTQNEFNKSFATTLNNRNAAGASGQQDPNKWYDPKYDSYISQLYGANGQLDKQAQGVYDAGMNALKAPSSTTTAPTPDSVASTTTMPNSTYMANGGSAAPSMAAYQKNPYIDQMAQGIVDQVSDNWSRNLAPSIRSGAMAAGGFGGSRQGVVEANAFNDISRGLGANLANLYGGDYTQDRQRALQKYQGDQSYNLGQANNNLGYFQARNSYDLGLRGNDLGFANLDANIYNSNFNNSLNAGRFGLDALQLQNSMNNQGINNATTMQNAPLNYFNNSNNNTMAAAGTGSPNQIAPQGNPYMAGAGAGLATYGGLNNYLRTTTGP